jgi:hypothetical protein
VRGGGVGGAVGAVSDPARRGAAAPARRPLGGHALFFVRRATRKEPKFVCLHPAPALAALPTHTPLRIDDFIVHTTQARLSGTGQTDVVRIEGLRRRKQ